MDSFLHIDHMSGLECLFSFLSFTFGPQPQNIASTSSNGALDSLEPIRRGRKKKPTSSSSSSTTISPPPKKTKHSRKIQVENATIEAKNRDPYLELYKIEDYDDGIEFPYDYPPLICCFADARKEFVPTVSVFDNQMDPDMYLKSQTGRCSSGTRLSS
ncbi:fructokinase-like 1, chloroplastic [Fagus crenata]